MTERIEDAGRISAVALALIPIFYVLGSLAWALHSASYGLGFPDLNQRRYVLVGLMVGLCTGGTFTLFWFGLPHAYREKTIATTGIKGYLNRFLALFASSAFAFLFVEASAIALKFLQPALQTSVVTFAVLAGASWMVALFRSIGLHEYLAPTSPKKHPRPLSSHLRGKARRSYGRGT